MNDAVNYNNNPLHGLSLKNLLIELIDHYGFEIMFAYLNINCFKTKPTLESSIKFLKKTDWAREKVEVFYLYEYKNLPRASSEQFKLAPRDRIIPDDQSPGLPAELDLEDAERLRQKRVKKAAAHKPSSAAAKKYSTHRSSSSSKRQNNSPWQNDTSQKPSYYSESNADDESSKPIDPWAKWKK